MTLLSLRSNDKAKFQMSLRLSWDFAVRAQRNGNNTVSVRRAQVHAPAYLFGVRLFRTCDRRPTAYFILMVSPLVPSCSLAPREVERTCKTTPSELRSTMPPMPPARVSPASAAT